MKFSIEIVKDELISELILTMITSGIPCIYWFTQSINASDLLNKLDPLITDDFSFQYAAMLSIFFCFFLCLDITIEIK